MTTGSRKRALARLRNAQRGDGDDRTSEGSGPADTAKWGETEAAFEQALASVSAFLTENGFDAGYYLAVNDDIRRAGIDPLRHFLRFGIAEGRIYHPALAVEPAEASTGPEEDVSSMRMVRSESFVLRVIDERRDLDAFLEAPDEEDELRLATLQFREFLSESGIDSTYYLAARPDVARSGADPVEHYVRYGLLEGRQFHPRARVVVSSTDRQAIEWGEATAVLQIAGSVFRLFTLPFLDAVDDAIIEQARAQWAHEPSLFACGLPTVRHLHMVFSGNLQVNMEFEVGRLLGFLDGSFGAVVVVSDLASEHAFRRASDVTWALARLGMRTLVVRTDGYGERDLVSEDGVGRDLGGDTVLVNWDQLCRMNKVSLLARLVNALKPVVTLVVDAPTGLEAVAQFGVGLSTVTRISCVYDATGISPGGGGTAARYAGLTAPYARTLTATRSAALRVGDLWGPATRSKVAVLPQRVAVVDETVMQGRLADRLHRMESRSGSRRWLWWPPPETALAEGPLARLAAARPADRFDVLMTGGEEHTASGDLPVNVHTVDLADVTASMAEVDGVILAHAVAGAARIALEMSQLLVPLVLGDSEDFRETFDPESAVFALLAGAGDEPAVALSAALDIVSRLTPDEAGSLLTKAWSLVRARHSDDAYLHELADVLGLGDD